MGHPVTPSSPSKAIDTNAKKDWHQHKVQSTDAKSALSKAHNKKPFPPSGLK